MKAKIVIFLTVLSGLSLQALNLQEAVNKTKEITQATEGLKEPVAQVVLSAPDFINNMKDHVRLFEQQVNAIQNQFNTQNYEQVINTISPLLTNFTITLSQVADFIKSIDNVLLPIANVIGVFDPTTKAKLVNTVQNIDQVISQVPHLNASLETLTGTLHQAADLVKQTPSNQTTPIIPTTQYETELVPDSSTPTKFIKPGELSQKLAYKLLGVNENADAFARLGLTEDASPVVIKQAFRQLALRYHPDKLDQSGDKRNAIKQQIQQLLNKYPELKKMAEEQQIDVASDVYVLQMGNLIFNIIRNAYNDLMKLETFPQIINDEKPLKPIESSISLRIVDQLRERLQQKPVIVLFGAPSSGKTEVMELALGQPYKVFDVRADFIDYWAQEKKKNKDEVKKQYKNLKNEEYQWILQEKDAITKNLMNSSEKIIVFDEFDLSGKFGANDVETKTAQETLAIAQEVSKKKKIVLIIHTETLQSPVLKNLIATQFNIHDKDIIKTGYFTPPEERFLLKNTNLTENEKQEYMSWAMGDPTAYLPLFKAMAQHKKAQQTFQDLKKEALKSAMGVYKVINITDKALAQKIHALVIDTSSLEDYTHQTVINDLVDTGLVGRVHNQYVLPMVVKEAILAFENEPKK